MRARDCVFHLECFACVQCKRVLTTGDSFGMIGHKVYCHGDFQTFVVQKQARRKRENGEGRSKKRKHEVLSCEGNVRFSLVSIYQTDVTSFDQFLKLFLFGFLILIGLELGLRLGLE